MTEQQKRLMGFILPYWKKDAARPRAGLFRFWLWRHGRKKIEREHFQILELEDASSSHRSPLPPH
jgi:hypothetical protein